MNPTDRHEARPRVRPALGHRQSQAVGDVGTTLKSIYVAAYEAGLQAAYAAGYHDGVQLAKFAATEVIGGWPGLEHDLDVLLDAIDELCQTQSPSHISMGTLSTPPDPRPSAPRRTAA